MVYYRRSRNHSQNEKRFSKLWQNYGLTLKTRIEVHSIYRVTQLKWLNSHTCYFINTHIFLVDANRREKTLELAKTSLIGMFT